MNRVGTVTVAMKDLKLGKIKKTSLLIIAGSSTGRRVKLEKKTTENGRGVTLGGTFDRLIFVEKETGGGGRVLGLEAR